MTDKNNKRRLLITSALPYANGDIHLGHLLEAVMTDVYVRYQRLRGNDVLYVCADDTHGTPIELSALSLGVKPEDMVDKIREDHIRDYAGYDISFDIFYTTHSDENRKYAELVYDSLRKNDLVVEREINQYFCEHDKRFLPDRFVVGTCPKCKAENQCGDVCEKCGVTYEPTDVIDPRCKICGKPPVLKASTHIYVELAKREKFLRDYINRKGVLQSDMKNFVATWIEDGLKEWCISRDGPYFGFKIPGTENKFFYVWMDAPIGYLSSTEKFCVEHGRDVSEFWHKDSGCEVVHFIGKDIVYFHALFWPVMLDSADFIVPSSLRIHGFLNVNGEKMSKSRGTFILAKEYLEKVEHPQAAEFLRFYFASKLAPTSADIDLAKDELIVRTNTTLANNIGNLHHRSMIFCERYFENKIPNAKWDDDIAVQVENAANEIADNYESGDFKSVVEKIQVLGNVGNKFFQDQKPWEMIKAGDMDGAGKVIVTCVNLIKSLIVFLKPITPKFAASFEKQLSLNLTWDDYKFSLTNHQISSIEKLAVQFEESHFEKLFGGAVGE